MKKNRLSGTLGYIISAALCFGVFAFGVNSLLASNQEDVQRYLRDNQIYGKSDEVDIVVKILNIIETDVQVDDTLMYIIETDEKVVLLESEKYDKDLKYIFDNKEKLKSGDYYLAVRKVSPTEKRGRKGRRTFYNITPEFMKDTTEPLITNIDIDLDKINKKVEMFEYVSLTRYKDSDKLFFWFSAIFGVVGVFLSFLTFWIIRKNIKEYRELDEAFPELRGDFSSIKTEAEYIDEKLKILVYRGYLIMQYKGFSITKLEDLMGIEIKEIVRVSRKKERYFYNITLHYLDGVGAENRIERFGLKKYKNRTMVHVQKFKEFISKNHPNIVIEISRE